MKPLVIHAGFHKTGTSTVQRFFQDNRKALAPHVVIVLKRDMEDLIRAARGYSVTGSILDRAKIVLRAEALFSSLKGRPKRALLLSAEELSGHMPGRPGTLDYRAAEVILGDIVRVARAVMPRRAVSLVLGTRAPAAWIESAYWEHVKSSSLTSDFADFAQKFHTASDLSTVAREIASRVAPVVEVPLETAVKGTGLVAPILELLDLPIGFSAQLSPPQMRNQRDPDWMLQEFLRINREVADRSERARLKKALRRGERPTQGAD